MECCEALGASAVVHVDFCVPFGGLCLSFDDGVVELSPHRLQLQVKSIQSSHSAVFPGEVESMSAGIQYMCDRGLFQQHA